jgi:hypothetical protein
MTDCIFEVQKAVYAKLSGDAALLALGASVYEYVPQDTAFPYVKIEGSSAVDWSTTTTQGWEVTVALSVFTRERGSKKSLSIAARCRELLHDATLAVSGCTVVSIRYVASDVQLLADGVTYQAGMVFKVFAQLT